MKHEAINVETAKTSELVAFYNKHAEEFGKKHVTKFADRATAELRVKQILSDLAETEEAVTEHSASGESSATEEPHDNAPDPFNEDDNDIRRSAAIAATWQDASVRAARAARHKVSVDGVEYGSVAKAFEALHLPKSKVISFRALLVAHGVQAIEGYEFTLVS